MKIQFNEAQLSRPQKESLLSVLDVLQSENQNEIEVTPVEFPLKLKVKLDDDIEMLLGWDAETGTYSGLTTPERLEQDIKDPTKETVQPEPEPEPELDLSPVVARVHALAHNFCVLIKPLNTNQRLECWIEFSKILFKELLKNEMS